MVDNSEGTHPMRQLCEEWLRKIKLAKDHKWKVFGQYAKETSAFYDGEHDWMWKEEYASGKGGFLDKESADYLPTFRMQVNKTFEAVALFGPALMHKYPNVMVSASNPPIIPPEALGLDVNNPRMVMMYEDYISQDQIDRSQKETNAELKQHYLNWLQIETDKKFQARRAITEAIVKGLGILWTELHMPKGSSIKYPRSVFVSCDDIVKDPDAEYAEGVQWIARRSCQPLNKVAEKFDIPLSELKGHMQSYESQATKRGEKDARSGKPSAVTTSYDLMEYWEVYSKNGFGHRLKATNQKNYRTRYDFDSLGDYTYCVVAKGIPFPLNYPTWTLQDDPESQFMRAQWPVPFWTDEGSGNGWPMSELHFYDKLNCVWPLSLIKPAIGELRFLNWCFSFLADKVAASSTTYVGIVKAAGVEIQDQLQKGLAPFTVVEIADILGKGVTDVVDFLDAPQFSIDIWKMVAEVLDLVDKRTGLTELIYGLTGTQIRSATEAGIRDQNVSIRPDDMAEKTEDWYSLSAMKECEAAVWALEANDVVGVLGNAGAMVFEQSIQGQDFEKVVRDYSYRIQAGSARKPNKNNRLRQLNEWSQYALPVIQDFALQGHVDPWNAYMSEVAKAMDFDASPFLINLPPPEENGPSPEEEDAEMKQTELEQKLAENDAKLEMDERQHDQDMEQDEEQHDQDMEQSREKHQLELKIMKAKAAAARKSNVSGPGTR